MSIRSVALFLIVVSFLPGRSVYAQKFPLQALNDYDIIKNYLFLQKKERILSSKSQKLTFIDETLKVRFDYSANGYGWSTIHIGDLTNKEIDYFLNHEVRQTADSSYDAVTILSSAEGAKTDRESWRHAYSLISQIKQQLLSPTYTSRLHQMFLCYSETNDGMIEDLHLKYSGHSDDYQSKIIEIIPSLLTPEFIFEPYRISERITRRHVRIKMKILNLKRRRIV